MICGTERIAYHRVPAYQVFYAENPEYKGEFCDTLQTATLKVSHIKYECSLSTTKLFR